MAFLNKLKVLLQIENQTEFARMCGKQPSNMANYLNGRVKPGDQVLRDCLLNSTATNLFRQEIKPLQEVEPIPKNRNKLPESGGIYILYDSAATVLYIGKATSFRAELRQTLNRNIPGRMRFGPDMRSNRVVFEKLAWYMSLYQINNEQLRHNIEALLIRVFINQTHNSNIAKFKKSRQVRHR